MDDALTPAEPKRFVPSGVDAQSWMGFEQRIQERRYRALVQQVRDAIARGDTISARVTLEEARELCPDRDELTELGERILTTPQSAPPLPFAWSRAMNAVTMLIAGVALVVAIEWIRPPRPLPSSRPLASAVTAVPVIGVASTGPVLVTTVKPAAAKNDDAAVVSNEPDLALPDPVATRGVQPAVDVARPAVGGPVPAPSFRPPSVIDSEPQTSAREVSDDNTAADARGARDSNAGDIEKASLETADPPTCEPSRVEEESAPSPDRE